MSLLEVTDLSKHYAGRPSLGDRLSGKRRTLVRAVNGVSLAVERGEILGLIGESGCGKSTLGRAILRLHEPTDGRVVFDGTDVTALPAPELKAMRRRMQIIFQDPVSSLNPRLKVGQIIAEGLIAQKVGSPAERRARVASLLGEVGLAPDAASRYPHEFSGGQRQRIGIARALALDPEFIVADESVSALDVSIQAQVLNLLLDLRQSRNLTMLFIAHDLSVVEYLCDQIVVMYLGRIVEQGPARQLYDRPAHPYTRALLSAIPHPDPRAPKNREVLADDIPSPLNPPSGCVFRTRCRLADAACAATIPPPVAVAPGQISYCLKSEMIPA
jgi:oligopeptide/dipeptide ABC transporter ATP-binding protein